MVKAVNIAAPGFLVVLLAACQASPARQAAASFDRPVRGPFIGLRRQPALGHGDGVQHPHENGVRADRGGQQSQPQAAG